MTNGWVRILLEMIEYCVRLKFRELIKLTIEANWLMIKTSRPIDWRRLLETDWTKAVAQGQQEKGQDYPHTILFILM